jgi:predicted Zn-dependent peptidase
MFVDVEESCLSNGVRVVTSRLPHVGSVSFGIWVGVGGRHEPNKLSGVSHFIEHMLFKGTPTRSSLQVSREIEGRGGHLNAFTQEESTCFYARVVTEQLSRSFDVLSDMVLNPSFDAKELEKERQVILEEMMMYRDQPHHLVHELLEGGLWPKHPLGRSLVGSERTIAGMSRDEMVGYKESRYIPSRIVCSFAGGVDHATCVEMVRNAFEGLARRRSVTMRKFDDSTPVGPLGAACKPIEQCQLALGFRVFGRSDLRRYPLKILSILLGENMSSRLFQVVRERHGLAYSVQSSSQLLTDTGSFVISAGLEKGSAVKTLRLILKELDRIRTRKVRTSELRMARDYAIGQLKLGLESTSPQMLWLGENFLSFGKFMDPAESVEALRKVTAEDVQDVAQEWLTSECASLGVVGPQAEGAECEQLSALLADL